MMRGSDRARLPEGGLGSDSTGRIISKQEAINLALLMAVDDRGESVGQVGLRFDGVEFTGLNARKTVDLCQDCHCASDQQDVQTPLLAACRRAMTLSSRQFDKATLDLFKQRRR